MSFYWLAFTTGLLGSLHCIGMCGPIALSLPAGQGSNLHYYFTRIQYNVGRILSYAALGAIMGIPGQWLQPALWQQRLSIVAGTFLLLSLFTYLFKGKISPLAKIYQWVASSLGKMMNKSGGIQWLLSGVLNGFLPCGLVYVALAGALTSGGISEGALYMTIFGFGTFPLMFLLSVSGKMLSIKVRSKIRNVIPIATFLVGTLLILRGLNLGIPYVSPQIKKEPKKKAHMECCEVKSERDSLTNK